MIKNVFQLHERLNLTYNEIFDISFQNIQIWIWLAYIEMR